jgi:Ca2+/H+ antiporter, TMEM165/GDT1 family
MDFKLFASTFAAIFLTKLGDTTQLATLSLMAGPASRWGVFFGSATALVCSSVLAVLADDFVARFIAPHTLQRVAGAVFLALSALDLFGRSS